MTVKLQNDPRYWFGVYAGTMTTLAFISLGLTPPPWLGWAMFILVLAAGAAAHFALKTLKKRQ